MYRAGRGFNMQRTEFDCTSWSIRQWVKQVRKLPSELRRSLTWNQGMEMVEHKRFTIAADVIVYFCDRQIPWQRGTNKNADRLLRHYFSKGTDLPGYSHLDLNKVALRLDHRPRKILGF